MNTHDTLAFAVASEAVRQIRHGDAQWNQLFSIDVFATTARTWPMPDFVISDVRNNITLAAEFKPPDQTKREYLTGLGQAVAYIRDFHYGVLVVPDVADDGYPIADHIHDVLRQQVLANVPVGLLRYDSRAISATNARFDILHALTQRTSPPQRVVRTEDSFWAKWRDASPTELGAFLEHLYDEGRPAAGPRQGRIRDRAFDRLWRDIQDGRVVHWGGQRRRVANTPDNKVAWGKNYRNFVMHIGWAAPDGKLTTEGLEALRLVHQYGPDSKLFLDQLALAVLVGGKHLVLINAINEFQDSHGSFADEQTWLDSVEQHLEQDGLLKRNVGRHQAAVRESERGFLKAEKTLWRNLQLIVPRGGRVYHPDRGFIFDWARITALLTSDAIVAA